MVLDKYKIINMVCEFYGVNFDQINVKTRKRKLVIPRQIIMYLLHCHNRYSLESAAKIFKRDHATASHAKKTINNLIDTDIRIREDMAFFIEQIKRMKYEKESIIVSRINLLDMCISNQNGFINNTNFL